MSLSGTIGTAIGMVLVFGLLSLLCSGITEMISNFTQMRANFLLTGLRAMLDRPEPAQDARASKAAKKELSRRTTDPAVTRAAAAIVRDPTARATDSDVTLALFDHPLVQATQTRRTRLGRTRDGKVRNPQYISSEVFTRALIDTLAPARSDATGQPLLENLRAALTTGPVKDKPCATALLALIAQSEGNLAKFEECVANWYDAQMNRIAGWYKRWSKVILGIVGFVAALVINIDAMQLAHGLYVDEPVRQAVVATAQSGTLCQNQDTAQERISCTNQRLGQLDAAGLPIGYPAGCRPGWHLAPCWVWSPGTPLHWWDFPLKIIGWAAVAFAVSFGAPFWFDALSRLGSLRNSGPKPA